ncbi:MAG: BMP family ABC transporter substrate-binding protein [Lachnospiraceae bacterium]|nr:BMP family ABC transporter substrate-binding protein [Lachnospiraceae bacterium]
MDFDDYEKAMHLGQKEYNACQSKGQPPYLPCLEDVIAQYETESKIKLGLQEIPLSQVVGTYAEGRSNAFARNFMPLLDKESEFARKWIVLAESMCEEGLREPILAYEFLNKFYVQEGNKRVSVSKYMGAVTIEANVTRVIPKRTDAKEILLYYEFLTFFEKTGVNYLNFTKCGSYALLLKEINEDPNFTWNEDYAMDLRSIYARFTKEYLAAGGDKLVTTPADALLLYLHIFGYEATKNVSSSELARNIDRIRGELRIYGQERQAAISLNPVEDPKKHVFTNLMSQKKHAAAWIYEKKTDVSAWTYNHELGREHVEDLFRNRMCTDAFYNIPAEYADEVIEDLIRQGYDIIFATSPQYIAACAKAAVAHPDVKILNCSLNTSYKSVRSYYLRTYEAKYIIGCIAGAMANDNKVGYIADYPVFGSVASINAFTLGARAVNPDVEVYLEWSTLKDHKPGETFAENNVTIISNRDMIAPAHASREFGLYQCGETTVNYAMPVWHWGKMYEEILRSILNNNWKDEDESVGLLALNYWWGMSAGAIDVITSQKLPSELSRLVEAVKKSIKAGILVPFSGLLTFQDGSVLDAGEGLPPEEIIRMNRLVNGIHGYVPGPAELRDEFSDFMTAQSVFRPEAETQL